MPLVPVYNTGTEKSELINTDGIVRVTPRTMEGGSAVYMASGAVILVKESIREIMDLQLRGTKW